jgi:hypothetical protein
MQNLNVSDGLVSVLSMNIHEITSLTVSGLQFDVAGCDIESFFEEPLRIEQAEARRRVDLESEVKKKTVYMMKALKDLQNEIQARRRTGRELETHTHLLEFYRGQ